MPLQGVPGQAKLIKVVVTSGAGQGVTDQGPREHCEVIETFHILAGLWLHRVYLFVKLNCT